MKKTTKKINYRNRFSLHSLRLCGFVLLLIVTSNLCLANRAPTENPYDVISKVFRPFFSVLLVGGEGANRAMSLRMRVAEVSGRLPKEFEGAELKAAVQFPNKVKLEAPVYGETFTVCRNGDSVWATPGQKVEYLLKEFKLKPQPTAKANTPLFLPFTAQQAVFLVALFSMDNAAVAEMEAIDGEEYRVIRAGLMPELASAAKVQDFKASLWVGSGYRPRRVEVVRKDFKMVIDIEELRFVPALGAETWNPAPGTADIYRGNVDYLEQLLYVVMNSLQAKEGSRPWEVEK